MGRRRAAFAPSCTLFFFLSSQSTIGIYLPNQRAAIGCQTPACHSPLVLFQHRLLRELARGVAALTAASLATDFPRHAFLTASGWT